MAYRAEIEIGVRGSSRLKELQDRITRLSRSIDDVNVETLINSNAVQSVESYTQALSKAATNLREVTVQLNAAGRASGDYADAISQYVTALGQSNAAQKLQNDLIAEEIELRRKQKLAASGIRESTQYGGPIGPGPASPVGMLAGQTSPVGERVSRILAGKEEQLELDRALFELGTKRTDQIHQQVSLQNNLVEGTREVYELIARYNREAATGIRPSTQYAGPIGPGPASPVDALVGQTSPVGERIARIRAYEAAAIDAANNVSKLAQEQEQAITQKELQNDDKVFREKLNKLVELGNVELQINKRNNEQALKDFNTRLANRTAGPFRTDGPLESRGFKSTQKSIGTMGESLALGAGFPLLFGGGAGSVAGSILGSFVGSGFGGQILGGALGQALDQALVRIRDIGNAVQGLNFDALIESGVRLTANLREQLNVLIGIGQAEEARRMLSQEIAIQTGTVAGTVEDVGNSVNILGDSWNKVTKTVGALLGILSAPFAVALAGILEVVNAIVYVVNTLVSLLAKGLKTIVEFVVNLIGGKGAADRVADGIRNVNKELDDANAKALSLGEKLGADVTRSGIKLGVAQRLTPGVTSEDKITNIELQAEGQLNQLIEDRFNARKRIRQENKSASEEIIQGLIRQSDAYYANESALVKLNSQRSIAAELERKAAKEAREAAEQARKAAAERERQLEASSAAYSRQLGLVSQTLAVTKQVGDYDIQRARILEGESSALQTQLEQNAARLLIEKELLAIQLEKALNAKNITDKERELLQGIYTQQLQLLKDHSGLKAQQLQLAISELNVRRQIAALESPRRQQDISQSRAGQIAGVEAQLAFPFGGDELERINQQQEQSARYYEAVTPLERELADLQLRRAETAASLNEEDRKLLDQQIAGKQSEIQLEIQALNQLSQKEKQLLQQQQVFKRYKFIADEISTAFSNSITGLITGTTTVSEAFGQMFENIGKAFIDMATEIIAKQLVMITLQTILKALGFAGGGGGGTFSGAGPVSGASASGVSFNPAAFSPGLAFADGGFVTGPTRAVVGEGGEPEYIIPASKMRGAMQRYSAGARGSSVIPANGDQASGDMGGGTAGATPIDVRYTVERINSVDYVTADQFRSGMQQAAQQGAQQGEQRTLRRLQMSNSTRKRLGM